MQKITIICVGKMTKEYEKAVQEYEKRLHTLCQFSVIELSEVAMRDKNISMKSVQQTLDKEAERILASVPKQARIVALCVEGKQMDSVAFSQLLTSPTQAGSVALVIGSSHGLSDKVKQKAEVMLSFSKMTFPHQLARLVLTEQVYRAFMIHTNSAYHK